MGKHRCHQGERNTQTGEQGNGCIATVSGDAPQLFTHLTAKATRDKGSGSIHSHAGANGAIRFVPTIVVAT